MLALALSNARNVDKNVYTPRSVNESNLALRCDNTFGNIGQRPCARCSLAGIVADLAHGEASGLAVADLGQRSKSRANAASSGGISWNHADERRASETAGQ